MKKFLAIMLMTTTFFLGGKTMADTLNKEQQSIAAVASYAARGNQDGLKSALIKGLDDGIPVNTFKEILVQAYAYCGFPRSLNALTTLMQVVDERGNKDNPGQEPSPKPSGEAFVYGSENQTKLV